MTCTNVAFSVAVNSGFFFHVSTMHSLGFSYLPFGRMAHVVAQIESDQGNHQHLFEGCLAPIYQRYICPYGYVDKRKRCLIESPPCGESKSRWIANGAALCIRKLASTYPGKNSLHTMQSLDIKTLICDMSSSLSQVLDMFSIRC